MPPRHTAAAPVADEAIVAVGGVMEVEVANDDGENEWKPARVVKLLSSRRFVACINGEADFLEEYGSEDEGKEWRRVRPADQAKVIASFDAAAKAWKKRHPNAYVVESILQQRRLPRKMGHAVEYLVKWKDWSEADSTWEPAAHLESCPWLVKEFKERNARRQDAIGEGSSSRDAVNAEATQGLTEDEVQQAGEPAGRDVRDTDKPPPPQRQEMACEGCGRVFKYRAALLKHQAMCVREDSEEDEDEDGDEDGDEDERHGRSRGNSGQARPSLDAIGEGSSSRDAVNAEATQGLTEDEVQQAGEPAGRDVRDTDKPPPPQRQEMACEGCGRVFKYRAALLKHQAMCVREDSEEDEDEDEDGDEDERHGRSRGNSGQARPSLGGFLDSTGRELRHRPDAKRQKMAEQAEAEADATDVEDGDDDDFDVAVLTEEGTSDEDDEADEDDEDDEDASDKDDDSEDDARRKAGKRSNAQRLKQVQNGGGEPTAMLCDASRAAKHRAATTAAAQRSGNAPLFDSYMPALHAPSAGPLTGAADLLPPLLAAPLSVRVARESNAPASAKSGKKSSAASKRSMDAEDGEAATSALVALEAHDAPYEIAPHEAETTSCGRGYGPAHLCNVGAAVWSTAWLESPGPSQPQYLAVGTHADTHTATHTPSSGPNAIQIWQMAGSDGGAPRLWLEGLHDGGGVLSLCWCPVGSACSALATGGSRHALALDRLGLLAAACADGSIRIFPIPTPESLDTAESSLPASARVPARDRLRRFRLWLLAAIKLEPTSPVLTTAIDWNRSSPELLAAGRDDGTVAVWDLNAPSQPTHVEGGEQGREQASEQSGEQEGEGSEYGASKGGDADLCLAVASVPRHTLGCSNRGSGEVSVFLMRGSLNATMPLGHAASVTSVRWAPPPHDSLLASVGKDGLLCVWDPQSPTPLRQRHNPGMPSWANDLAWAPSAPAIFTSMDIVAVRLQALREDIVIPPLSDKTPGGTKRWRATGGSRGGNEGVLPSGRVLVLGCAPTASVCALSVSAGGERLAGVSNDGRLEVFREVRSQLTKKAFARTLEGVGMLQITTPADESPGGTALHVALGAAAKAVNTAATGGKAYVPSPQMALRALSWNPNEHHSEWLACGGDAGLLIFMKVHR